MKRLDKKIIFFATKTLSGVFNVRIKVYGTVAKVKGR